MSDAWTVEDKEAIEARIIDAFADNPRLTLGGAAESVGISRSGLYKLLETHPGMNARIRAAHKHAKEAATDAVVESLYDRATDVKNGSGTVAAIFLTKNLRPAEFGDKPAKQGAAVHVHIERAVLQLAASAEREALAIEAGAIDLPVEGSEG